MSTFKDIFALAYVQAYEPDEGAWWKLISMTRYPSLFRCSFGESDLGLFPGAVLPDRSAKSREASGSFFEPMITSGGRGRAAQFRLCLSGRQGG